MCRPEVKLHTISSVSTDLETKQAPESKKTLHPVWQTWRKPAGNLIGPHEEDQHTDSTLCLHKPVQV